jgi:hypothetical protein
MKSSNRVLLLLVTALLGASAAAADFQQGMVELKAEERTRNPFPELCARPPGPGTAEWGADGHYFTTNKVAELAGLDADLNREITLFSQAPDDLSLSYSATAVAIWGVVWIPYRQRIVNTLHSLHGGHDDAVRTRRKLLAAKIKAFDLGTRDPEELWKVGFLIHALGDSYAHVHGTEDHLKAYNQVWGHAWDSVFGTDPDKIGHDTLALKNYLAYAKGLYDALDRSNPPSTEKRARFDEWLALVEAGNGTPYPDAAKVKIGTLPCDAREEAQAILSISKVDAYLKGIEHDLEQPPAEAGLTAPASQDD